jgi:hypothetical protein
MRRCVGPRFDYRQAPGNVFTAALSCLLISGATIAFFWIYDATVHRDVAFIPNVTVERHPARSGAVGQAPEPDMDSLSVRIANSDVEPQVIRRAEKARAEIISKPETSKKKARSPKRLPAEAANAFASSRSLLPAAPLGGW